MITYKEIKINETIIKIQVKLDNITIGTIKKVNKGWQYTPKGQRYGGDIFAKLNDCKQSLN